MFSRSSKRLSDQLINRLANHGFKTKKTQYSPLGLILLDKTSDKLTDLDEFINGQFEIQDEGSQLVALQVDCIVDSD